METTKKNQRIIVRKFKLVNAMVASSQEDEPPQDIILAFEQVERSLFVKRYPVRVKACNINLEELKRYIGPKSSNGPETFISEGYIKDGHLHLIHKLEDYKPIDLDEYEEDASFPHFKPKGEEELHDIYDEDAINIIVA